MSEQPEDPLVELVQRGLELQAAGQEVDVDALCADQPHLRTVLAEALSLAPGLSRAQEQLADSDVLLGTSLNDRYRLDVRLGAGAMGVVYRAFDEPLGREVAVKILRTDSLTTEQALARFDREAAALASIDHDHVVTVFDRGVTEHGAPFLVMRLLEGSPLDLVVEMARDAASERGGVDRLTATDRVAGVAGFACREPSWFRTVARWAGQLADGLDAAHARGIFHRDVKPSNVFVERDGSAVLLDFGIAAEQEGQTLTDQAYPLGTLAYMAPERLSGRRDPDARIDVYGLGATLYHLLTLSPPYGGSALDLFATMQRHDPAPIRKRNGAVPLDLVAICERAMARAPHRRYPTMRALRADLDAFLGYRPVSARPISAATRWVRQARRSPLVRNVVFALLVVVAALAGVYGWQRSEAERSEQWAATWARVPPSLLRWRPANRRVEGPFRAEIDATLDRAVELGDVLPARLYRSVFRFDQGDVDGAVRDMRVILAGSQSPFLAAVVDGLSWWPSSPTIAQLDELPPARSRVDRLVLALFLMRIPQDVAAWDRALDLLTAEEFVGDPTAIELAVPKLLRRIYLIKESRQREFAAQRLLQQTLAIEHLRGRPTAHSAHMLGTIHLVQRRYADALEPMQASFRLCPRFRGARSNLGVVFHRLGRLDEAVEVLTEALVQYPGYGNAIDTLTLVRIARGELDQADQLIEANAEALQASGKVKLSRLRGLVLYARAEAVREQQGLEHARPVYARAHHQLVAGRYKGVRLAIARGYADGDITSALPDIIRAAEDDPTQASRLLDVATLLPDDPSAEVVQALRTLFRTLASHLSTQRQDPQNR